MYTCIYIYKCDVNGQIVNFVYFKVEMLSSSSRHLLHQSAPTSVMRSSERMDHVLSHDVKDMGEHTLGREGGEKDFLFLFLV